EKEPIPPKAESIAKTTAGTTHAEPLEYVWIEDDTPVGARLQGNTPWQFVEKPYPVYSGARPHRPTADGIAQHFFDSAKDGLQIGEGDRFFTYVYLDPNDPPNEFMLQFFTDGWDRRAFWGDDSFALGGLNR